LKPAYLFSHILKFFKALLGDRHLPVDELPVDELPVDELPVDELPVDELPVDELPVDELLFLPFFPFI